MKKFYKHMLGMMLVFTILMGKNSFADQDSGDQLTNFVNGVAGIVYKIAWPTASYTNWQYIGLERNADEIDLTVRLVGTSAFDNSELWTNVTFELTADSVRNVIWGQNNGIVPPGATLKAFGDAMDQLNRHYQTSQGRSSPPEGTSDLQAPPAGGSVPTASTPLVGNQPQALGAPPAFLDGMRDRRAWESWFADVPAEYQAGANFWAGQRSLATPMTCEAQQGQSNDWMAGCVAARERLSGADVRRKTEPLYREGWNAPLN